MYSIVLFMVETSFSGFFGIRRNAHVCSGEDRRYLRVRDPPGERDVVGEVEPATLLDQVVEAVTRSDEGEADVASPESVDDVIGDLQDEVHAILWPHDTQVCGEVRPGTPKVRFRRSAVEPRQIRARPDDRHVRLSDAVALHRDLTVRVVGGDHVVRGPHGAALHQPQRSVDELVPVRKARLIQLRAKVVVIEHEGRSVQEPKEDADGPEQVGRVAALDDGEPTAPNSPSD